MGLKEFTQYDIDINIHEAVMAERRKHFYILNYLLNLHSHSIKEGGLDYEKAFESLEDYEHYLSKDL